MKIQAISLVLLALTYNVAHAQPGVITYAVIGAADPDKKVTTLNGVPGAGVSNVSVALPSYILKHGVVYTVTIGAQNYTYTGTCVAKYALGSGVTGATNISTWSTSPFNCPATSLWTFPFPVSVIPNTPGPALLTATITYGTTPVVMKVPLVIE
jgi:hypothetical protein